MGSPGADNRCGQGTDSCCASYAVPGGTYAATDENSRPITATVSAFKLDAFEVTVGRLRAFYHAMGGDVRGGAPAAGAGAHPKIADSGWRTSFATRLPRSWDEINARHIEACSVGGDNANFGATTWTVEPGANEDKPVNCVDWYTMFAFCVWDGGRLPTDAEWGFVAQSGDENRVYPYGNAPPTFSTLADVIASDLLEPPDTMYLFTQGDMYAAANDGPAHIAPVGRKTERSKWGHADLTANVIEMTLDFAAGTPENCVDCANVGWPDPPAAVQLPTQPPNWQTRGANGEPVGEEFGNERAAQDGIRLGRGSSWQGEWGGHFLKNGVNRFWLPVWRTYSAAGGRCARDLR